ncbi:MAG: tetratricopeptide repeat protein [Bacteroidales bacterium]
MKTIDEDYNIVCFEKAKRMQGTQIKMKRKLKTRTFAGFSILAMGLSILVGCAGRTLVDHERYDRTEPSVARLKDGREGFIIKEVPKMDEALRGNFDRAVAMLKHKDYGQAIDLLQKVIEQSPGVTAPYINIAIAYQAIGKQEQAEENLKTALKLFPEHPVICNEYGLLYRKTGRFAEAKAIYETTLARFPGYYPAHRNLGILCDLYLNDPACALEHYEIYREANPEDKQVNLWISGLRAGFRGN